MPKPQVSVVVVVYNIPREAPRTLYSLSAEYQRDIAADDYEVIVVDNGSNPPFDAAVLEGLAGNFRLIRLDPAPPSPAHAINVGLAAARGDVIGVLIDGARMVTPGLLHFARAGSSDCTRAPSSPVSVGISASTSKDGRSNATLIRPAKCAAGFDRVAGGRLSPVRNRRHSTNPRSTAGSERSSSRTACFSAGKLGFDERRRSALRCAGRWVRK